MFEEDNRFYIVMGVLFFLVGLTVALFFVVPRSKVVNQPLKVTTTVTQDVMPDKATVSISVVTLAHDANTSLRENTEKSNALINAFKQNPYLTIETTKYTLNLKKEWNPDLKKNIVKGYEVYNTIKIKTQNIKQLGDVINKAVSVGGNRIEGISFALSDEKKRMVTSQLIVKAVGIAKGRASLLAGIMKKKVMGIENIDIQEPYFPVYYKALGNGLNQQPAPPNIQPQSQKVTLTAVVTFKVK